MVRFDRGASTWSSNVCSSFAASLAIPYWLIAQHRHKQVGDAGRAHFAKRGELLTIE